ncbi:type 12 methyltransferase-like protein, partial [Leptotrombidium deliense]
CHFGIDSLCWARRGANVVGVDFCSQSIEEAKKLNEELGLNASFVCSDIYSLNEVLKKEKEQFDIVYTSYGVIDWLPDLNEWASVIAYFLKPNGFFYIVEYHQFMKVLDDNFERVEYSYVNSEIIESDVEGSYAVPEPGISKKEYTWNHSFSEILNSLIQSGLRIEFFNEHMNSPFDCFRGLCVEENGSYCIPTLKNKIPLLFSVKASKQ